MTRAAPRTPGGSSPAGPPAPEASIGKLFSLAYGSLAYLLFLAVFVYLVGFVGNVLVPRSIDHGPSAVLGVALVLDVGLLALFGLQHSIMARRWFKRWWTRIVPPHLERSTFVLASSLVLAVVMAGWHPIPDTVWQVESAGISLLLEGLFWSGWVVVLLSTFLIDHFRLFGLRQVWARLRGHGLDRPRFQTPFLYRWVRHPLYLGFLLAFWSTPHMTVGHLLFAGVWTAWILLAVQFEERDLERVHGSAYHRYRKSVPMILPRPTRPATTAPEGTGEVDGERPEVPGSAGNPTPAGVDGG